MSTTWERIARRLVATGKSARAISLAVSEGRNPDMLRSIKDGRSQLPRGGDVLRLANELGVSVEWLVGNDDTQQDEPDAQSKRTPPVRHKAKPEDLHAVDFDPNKLAMDVPVLGTAAASAIGAFTIGSDPIEYVRRPPALASAKNVYALYVQGDSMVPRYRPGDLVFVSPDRPASAGDDVIVQTRNYEGGAIECVIKQFVKRNCDYLILQQLNTPAEIKIKLDIIIGVHRILTMRELFGM